MTYKTEQRLSDEEVINRLIYRDAMILVFNKPSGIAVHPANGSKHNLEQYFHLLQFGLAKPVLAHRLDLGTSGCLVLARHKESARRLQALFTESKIKKSYIAIVKGRVTNDEGQINVALSKQSELKKHWWMKADPTGTISAISNYRVLDRGINKSILELNPITGRTHQLRVHCAYIGHPILGDYIYDPNNKESSFLKLHLHAKSIEIPLYKNKPPIKIEAALPEHMLAHEL